MYQPRTFKIRPRIAIPVYRDNIGAAYIQQPKQWIDCSYADVPHYGLESGYSLDKLAMHSERMLNAPIT